MRVSCDTVVARGEDVDEQMVERDGNLSNWFKDEAENWGQNSSGRNEFTKALIFMGLSKESGVFRNSLTSRLGFQSPLIYLPIVVKQASS